MRGPNGNLQSRPREMYVHLEWSNHRTLLEEGLSGSFMVLGLWGEGIAPPNRGEAWRGCGVMWHPLIYANIELPCSACWEGEVPHCTVLSFPHFDLLFLQHVSCSLSPLSPAAGPRRRQGGGGMELLFLLLPPAT